MHLRSPAPDPASRAAGPDPTTRQRGQQALPDATRPDPDLPDLPGLPSDRLVVRSRPLISHSSVLLGEDGSPDLLRLLPDEPSTVAWWREGQGLVGWGVAARLDVSGADRFDTAARWWTHLVTHAVVRDDVGVPGSGLVALGSFAFEDEPTLSTLVVPKVIVGRRDGRTWVTTIATEGSLPGPADLPGTLEGGSPEPARPPVGVRFAEGARSRGAWSELVTAALSEISAGVVDKVVLARDLIALADEPVDLRWVAHQLAASYPSCWTYLVDGLVGATPEILVRVQHGLVTSRVLAGTIRRTGDESADAALAGRLARSSKDLEEHEYAVRSVANALAAVCSSINVPESPFVLHLPNVMHLATDVAGVLSGEPVVGSPLQLVGALHPSAAVAGTPSTAARAVIARLEGMDRGRYAGPVGWLDAHGNGEWGIALRCAAADAHDPRRLRLFAGCGIVPGSDPAAELAESDAKLLPVRDALTRRVTVSARQHTPGLRQTGRR